eukprot:5509958-Pleurochrysis_carterae.AAC.6
MRRNSGVIGSRLGWSCSSWWGRGRRALASQSPEIWSCPDLGGCGLQNYLNWVAARRAPTRQQMRPAPVCGDDSEGDGGKVAENLGGGLVCVGDGGRLRGARSRARGEAYARLTPTGLGRLS